MAENPEKHREPWIPRINGMPLFTNSADYERNLAHSSNSLDFEIANEEPKDDDGGQVSSSVPDPIVKPA
jgi:hypothetical protein